MYEHENPELHNKLTNIIVPQFKNLFSFKITDTEAMYLLLGSVGIGLTS